MTPRASYTPPTVWPIWLAVAVLYGSLAWLADRALEQRWPEPAPVVHIEAGWPQISVDGGCWATPITRECHPDLRFQRSRTDRLHPPTENKLSWFGHLPREVARVAARLTGEGR